MSEQPANTRRKPAGLHVTLDRLDYGMQPVQAPCHRPHMFTYHLTIHNAGPLAVTILARKWILTYADGEMDVIEGDKVVGKTPHIGPGQAFSYASFHLTGKDAVATGAFHGIDENGKLVSVPIPAFELRIPKDPLWS